MLVALRSAVFVLYEQAHFDSDQAVTGLMARDIAHLHAFPLFFYGQQYLLAVEAWLAAPLLLLFGTSVAALKTPLSLLNVAVVVLVLRGLIRDEGLTPGAALAATLFVAMPPPVTASRLVEAGGCNIEPFVFVLIMWSVRARPFWFGAVLSAGFLTREFAMYGAVALAVLAVTRQQVRPAAAFGYLWRGAAAFAAVDVVVRLLSGVAANFDRVKSAPTLRGVDLTAVPAQLVSLLTGILPTLFGARLDPLARFNIASALTTGHPWLGPSMLAVGAAIVIRLVVLARRGAADVVVSASPFALYLLLVGAQAAAGFALISNTDDMQVRYTLLALFVPAAIAAMHLRAEPLRPLRVATLVLVTAWTGMALFDHARLIVEYQTRRPPSAFRELALYLEHNGMIYGDADYWTAYHVTYLSDTRVLLTPHNLVRIAGIDRVVDAHRADAVHISAEPCPGGAHLRLWYICR